MGAGNEGDPYEIEGETAVSEGGRIGIQIGISEVCSC